MQVGAIFRLLLLAAIWGGSFVFLRIVTPVLGPIITADLRVLIAWGVLTIYLRILGIDMAWRRFWKQYLVIGASMQRCRLFSSHSRHFISRLPTRLFLTPLHLFSARSSPAYGSARKLRC